MFPEIPNYEILSEIGHGGMACVYRARHVKLDRHVALKVMSRALNADPSFGQRFIREAQIVAQLSHPNIIQIFDVDSYEDHHYLSMELAEGHDLHKKIRQGMNLAEIVNVLSALSSALDYAASKGYVHRDIKPGNILFKLDGTPVLTDFGIAKATDSNTNMTITGSVIGTPSYMSPEQAQGIPLKGPSDLYALGVIFFEMLTGELPFNGETSVSIAIKHLTEPVPQLPEQFAYLQLFLNKALAKNPDDRFQTGEELTETLTQILLNANKLNASQQHLPNHSYGGNNSTVTLNKLSISGTMDIPAQAIPSQVISAEATQHLSPADLKQLGDEIGKNSDHTTSFVLNPKAKNRKLLIASFSLALIVGLGSLSAIWINNSDSSSSSTAVVENIPAAIAAAKVAFQNNELTLAAENYKGVLQKDGGNREAIVGLKQVSDRYIDQITTAISSAELESALLLMNQLKIITPDNPKIESLNSQLSSAIEQRNNEAVELASRNQTIRDYIEKADSAITKKHYVTGSANTPNESAYHYYHRILKLDANNSEAKQGLNGLVMTLLDESERQINTKNFSRAQSYIDEAIKVLPAHGEIPIVQLRLNDSQKNQFAEQTERDRVSKERNDKIQSLLAQARSQLEQGAYLKPEEQNAYSTYLAILKLAPNNVAAKEGIKQIAAIQITAANQHIQNNAWNKAQSALANAAHIDPYNPLIAESQELYSSQKNKFEQTQKVRNDIALLFQQGDQKLAAKEYEQAASYYKSVLKLDPRNSSVSKKIVSIGNSLLDAAREDLQKGQFDQGKAKLNAATKYVPKNSEVVQLLDSLPQLKTEWQVQQKKKQQALAQRQKRVKELLQQAEFDLKAGRHAEPAGNNAYEKFATVLQLEKRNKAAQTGIQKVAAHYAELAQVALNDKNLSQASNAIQTLQKVNPNQGKLASLVSQYKSQNKAIDAEKSRLAKLDQLYANAKEYEQLNAVDKLENVISSAESISKNKTEIGRFQLIHTNRLIKNSRTAYSAGQFQEAINHAENGLKYASDNQVLLALKSDAEAALVKEKQRKKKQRTYVGF